MKKLLFIFVSLFATIYHVEAQEQGVYRHYTIFPTLINPGATGFEPGAHQIMGNVMNTWTGVFGTPVNYTLGYSGDVGSNVGLGLQLMSESNAAINRFKAALNYAYKLQFENVEASIGLTTEYQQKNLRSGILNDPQIDPTDPNLLAANDGVKYFDFGLGIFTRFNKTLTIGIGLPNMVHAYINKPDVAVSPEKTFLGNFTGYVANRFKIESMGFDVEPALALRKVAAGEGDGAFLGDLNVTGYFLDNRLIGGLSYHFGENMPGGGILLGINLGNVGIYYSFDIYNGDYQPYNNGKHEISVGVNLFNKAK